VEAIEFHFKWENDTLRRIEKMRLDAEPLHLNALVKFAARAYRRPLTATEREDTLAYYKELRGRALSHGGRPRFHRRILMSRSSPTGDLVDLPACRAATVRERWPIRVAAKSVAPDGPGPAVPPHTRSPAG
jgi:hypothetical protein